MCCAPLGAPEMTDEQAEATAELFKALSHPERVRILNLIATCGEPVCVCDVTDHVGLAQPTITFHLKKLVAAGILRREQRGTWAFFSIEPGAAKALREAVKLGGR